MRATLTFPRFFSAAFAAICFFPAFAWCQDSGPAAALAKPSANNEIFKALRSQCETEVACGKGSGDICAQAAAILLGDDPPDEFRDMNQAQNVKIALRLLERGVDSSNLAMGRAYYLYSKVELFGLFGGYSDPYRANELMAMMIKKSYPGGALRKARAAVAFFALTVAEAEKKEGCATAKKLAAEGKLDSDSAKIAEEVLDSGYCKGLAQSN